jgi:Sec-independent protein translocase protein TatA
MNEVTTVQLNKSVVRALKGIKKYPRETYNELILDLIKAAEQKRASQYDEFIHKVQQSKMKELWDNKEDEVWENA